MIPSRTDDPRRGIDAQVGEDRAAICRCLKAIPTSAVPSNSRMLTAPSSPFFCKRILVRSSATDPKRETPGGCFILVIPPALLPAVRYREDRLIYAGKVRNGFVPHLRRQVASQLAHGTIRLF